MRKLSETFWILLLSVLMLPSRFPAVRDVQDLVSVLPEQDLAVMTAAELGQNYLDRPSHLDSPK
jgi:hypothetical protein